MSSFGSGQMSAAVLARNVVPGVHELSEGEERAERSERAEQCSEHSRAFSGHAAAALDVTFRNPNQN